MAWVLPAVLLACTGISSGRDPVAIEFVSPPDTVEVGDTAVVHVRALDRAGDSVAALIHLVTLTPDTLGIDSALNAVVGVAPGPGRIVAITGNLTSDPLRIIVATP